ncbi:hypothetical protein [Actinoallomurus soli]|uniref:hypothetical protein n=1 Tax=Actinoallomurus soli TaxID=2952535 RepID=UPI0020934001|nr:hypothetical protein [Actinoallomurus soli]MCO5968568.1 hypothetical protein [Actinoallomurus soli]
MSEVHAHHQRPDFPQAGDEVLCRQVTGEWEHRVALGPAFDADPFRHVHWLPEWMVETVLVADYRAGLTSRSIAFSLRHVRPLDEPAGGRGPDSGESST